MTAWHSDQVSALQLAAIVFANLSGSDNGCVEPVGEACFEDRGPENDFGIP